MLILLSYPLTKKTPLYPGTKGMQVSPDKSRSNGDSSNTHQIQFSNHSSTHVDAPLHFCNNKASVSELLEPVSVFSPAYCINIPKTEAQSICRDDFQRFNPCISDAQALLVRTGFYKYRQDNPQMYATNPPWVDPRVPSFLREICPDLKVFGIDTISVSNPNNREAGRESHRSFLCDDNAIMLIEDMDLRSEIITENVFSLNIFPWILEPLDGVQVMTLAEIKMKE